MSVLGSLGLLASSDSPDLDQQRKTYLNVSQVNLVDRAANAASTFTSIKSLSIVINNSITNADSLTHKMVCCHLAFSLR